MNPPSGMSDRETTSQPRDLRGLISRVGDGARGAAAAAIPLYRRLLPTIVRAYIPDAFRRTVRWTFGIKDPYLRVQELRLRLNDLGFVERALDELKHLSETGQIYERQLANWTLAVWYANQRSKEGAASAIKSLDQGLDNIMQPELRRREAVLRAECNLMLGDARSARCELTELLAESPHADLYLAAANLVEDPKEKIAQVNLALGLSGLPGVSLQSDPGDPVYDALTVEERLPEADGPKISVIVPAFNAAEHISTALNALLAQTWSNLEVLVVDDHSSDSTPAVVASFASRDARIKLIEAGANRGSYVARNIGLREASGDFVTTHDADDWSHPKKLEIQARHLISHPRSIANMSQQARATSELVFHRRGSPGFYIFDNMSSLMFRREKIQEKLGYWDSVRFGADSELIARMRSTFGFASVVSLIEAGPLSFQRQSDTSLTGSSVFGYHGFLMGARLAYHEASRRHHRVSRRYTFPQQERPFAVPEPMRPVRAAKGEKRVLDIVLAADFRAPGRVKTQVLERIAREQGRRVGLVQMSRYDHDPHAPILPEFHNLADQGDVQFIVVGERVVCEQLLVLDAQVLEAFQRFVPEVEAGEVLVSLIEEDMPARLTTPEATAAWLEACKRNADRYFGTTGKWPASTAQRGENAGADTRN